MERTGVLPEDGDRPGGRLQRSRQEPDRRGLAGTRWTDQPQDRAALDGQADPVDRELIGELDGGAVDDHRVRHPLQRPRCADRHLNGLGGAHRQDSDGGSITRTAATQGPASQAHLSLQ
jgi:hypothetical protein